MQGPGNGSLLLLYTHCVKHEDTESSTLYHIHTVIWLQEGRGRGGEGREGRRGEGGEREGGRREKRMIGG